MGLHIKITSELVLKQFPLLSFSWLNFEHITFLDICLLSFCPLIFYLCLFRFLFSSVSGKQTGYLFGIYIASI
jgi:hypothetical protein